MPPKVTVKKEPIGNVLKPEIKEYQNPKNWESSFPINTLLESQNMPSINTYVNKTDILNNVKSNAIFNNNKKEKRSDQKEYLAQEMAEKLDDDHSLGFYRKVVDTMPESLIFQALSEVKDAYLTGRVKKSKAALFTSVIQSKALEHNIKFDVKKTGN